MRKILVVAIISIAAISCKAGGITDYVVRIVKQYPHDVSSYTQGLFFHNGELYESTGEYGSSTLRKVDLQTGKALRKLNFGSKYFIEGSSILGDKLYVLTWTNKLLFVYDAETLEYKQSFSYPREGWGMTTEGKHLIVSDGSDKIWFLDSNLKTIKTLNVTINGRPLRLLNELEWIDGRIWANIYTTDRIAIINPDNGIVEGLIDCSGLLPKSMRTPDTDVLNGIAKNPKDGKIYLTGKNWPRMFEVELVKKKQ